MRHKIYFCIYKSFKLLSITTTYTHNRDHEESLNELVVFLNQGDIFHKNCKYQQIFPYNAEKHDCGCRAYI